MGVLFGTAFREHPFRQPIIGHRDVFAAVTRESLLAYYRARYVPENLVVVIVGDIDPAGMRAEVLRQFGAAPRQGLAPVLVPAEPLQLAPREDRRREDVEITRGVLAWPIPGLPHPDSAVLGLVAMALGHGDSSILWREIREKSRLVHSIDASSWNPWTTGLFCIAFTCDAGKRAAAEAAIMRAVDRCAARGFTPGQVGKAVRQLVVGEINTRKTMGGQASRLGVAEVVIGDLGYSQSYFERLRGVSPADLRRVLRAHLVPERRTAASIEPLDPKAAPPSARVAAGGLPDFAETRLPNGARLLLQTDRRLPNLHLRLLFEGGPLHEEAGQRGATALLATLLTKDTRKRSADEVAQRIEEVGGTFYPVAGNNSVALAAEVLPPDAERALATLADAVLEPAFAAATFAIERDAQLAALRQDADDVVTFARKRVRRDFFGAHPLALDPQGDEAGVQALTPASLAALHRRLCVAGNIVLVVTGDIPSGLVPQLKAFLRRLPRGRTPAWTPWTQPLPARPGDFVEKQPREQAVVLQAFPGPRVLAEDFYVGEVADELFSGMASRLFERVREEKGLAYFIRSARVSGLDAGMFCFLAGTQPGREGEVLGEIDAEIARVQADGVEAAELLRCQTRLKAARRQGLQTNGARASQAGIDALQGCPVNDGKKYDARIDSVTRAQLAEFARRHFRPALRTQLVVRP